MPDILLKKVLLSGREQDVLIHDHKFAKVAENISEAAAIEVVDCRGLAILPPFYNGHCHAAMTLLRGYADDLPLFTWLNDYIWPIEAKLTPQMINIGAKLAAIEMIRSGTVFFNDMYWNQESTLAAAEEFGLRACIGATFTDGLLAGDKLDANFEWLETPLPASGLIQYGVMPHAIYTAGEDLLLRCGDFAKKHQQIFHIHLAETAKEVADCQAQHGCTPVEYLSRLNLLDSRTVLAHCVHLTDHDRELLAASGAVVVLNLVSNLKLSSGIPEISKMLDAGVRVIIGTDGASSNNNLDMHEEMKLAAILAKVSGGAEALPAGQVLDMATRQGALAFGLDAGIIREGALADALLVRLDNERMCPLHNIVSNWVYSADSRAIDSVICDGRFLMRQGVIAGEREVLDEARAVAGTLMAK